MGGQISVHRRTVYSYIFGWCAGKFFRGEEGGGECIEKLSFLQQQQLIYTQQIRAHIYLVI